MHSVVKVTVVVPAKSLGVVSGEKRTEGGKLLLTSRPINQAHSNMFQLRKFHSKLMSSYVKRLKIDLP